MHAEGAPDEVVDEEENQAGEIERIEALLRDAYAAWKSGDVPSPDYFSMRRDLDVLPTEVGDRDTTLKIHRR
jgi:hypothetical protein